MGRFHIYDSYQSISLIEFFEQQPWSVVVYKGSESTDSTLRLTDGSIDEVIELVKSGHRGGWYVAGGSTFPPELPNIFRGNGICYSRQVALFAALHDSGTIVLSEWGGWHDYGYAVIGNDECYGQLTKTDPELFPADARSGLEILQVASGIALPFDLELRSAQSLEAIRPYFSRGVMLLASPQGLDKPGQRFNCETDAVRLDNGSYLAILLLKSLEDFVELANQSTLQFPYFLFPPQANREDIFMSIDVEAMWLEDAFGIVAYAEKFAWVIADGLCEDCGFVVLDQDKFRLETLLKTLPTEIAERAWVI